MVHMQKMTATWAGFTGAPGTSTVYFAGTSIVSPQTLATFFNAWAPYIPATVNINVNNSGELVDSDNGQVTGTWSTAPATLVTGSAVGGVLLVSQGPLMRLETGSFRRGKHIRGRMFLVPCSSAAVSSNGTVSAGVISALNAAATTMITASGSQLGVFHRPLKNYAINPPPIVQNGEFIPVPTMTCNAKVAVLRSRRD